ncbi:MAG: Bax inhibitor-1/YccA family protein [Candidatus Kapaibacteriota bacterium]|jgi:FtsH-binding integral membrane protein
MQSYNPYNPSTIASAVSADTLRTYVQRVYAWMVGGLLITALTAAGISSSPALIQAIFGTPLMWVVMLAPIGLVFFLGAKIETMQTSTAASVFVVFSVLMGISLSSIFMVYALGSIFQVFLIAAGMYGAAAVYGYTTKRDLTGMGSFLFMGLIGIVLASVVNWFLQSDALSFAVSVIGVLVFTGMTAWEMQKIKSQAVVMYAGEALATKRAILGALSLYLNFVNLFLFLLRLLGDRR